MKMVYLLIACLFIKNVHSFPGQAHRSIPLPNCCSTGIAYDGSLLWVSDHKEDSIYGINPENGKVERKISSPAYRPYGLTYDGKYLWNADSEGETIYKIDIEKGMVISAIPSPVNFISGLSSDGNFLIIGDKKDKKIHKIDPLDGTVVYSIPAPSQNISALLFAKGYIWVGDRINDEIYMVHPQNGIVAMIIPSPSPHITGLSFIKDDLIAIDYQSDKIYFLRIDDKEYILKGGEKNLKVEFIFEIRNHGPDSVFDGEVFIAVPHNTQNQKILNEIVFQPDLFKFLDDGDEKIAYFKFERIEGGEIKKVKMALNVTLFNLRYMIFPENVQNKIPEDIKKKYLGDDSKYLINDAVIKNAMSEVIKDENNIYWKARKLYQFVIDKLSYEMTGGWNPAPRVLQNGRGSCSEYSFLLISLLRSAGIPSRFVGSIVVRGDDASWDDVYHRWVEIYLPPYGWIPADANKGDKEFPYLQAKGFGELDNKVLITTTSKGYSPFLDWNYNVNFRYKCNGKCLVKTEGIAEWEPR